MRRLDSLTTVRGLAACLIVIFHAGLALGLAGQALPRLEVLKISVSLFFILSGFVLTWTWGERSPVRFWQDRAARLLPVYVFAWLLTLAGRSFARYPDESDLHLIASLLLVQAWLPDPSLAMAVNPPGWSLSCEIAFYLMLPVVAARAVLWTPKARLWALGIVAGWLTVGTVLTLAHPITWWAGFRGAEFAVGILMAAAMRQGWRPTPLFAFAGLASAVGIVVVFGTGAHLAESLNNLLALPLLVAIIGFGADHDLRGHTGWSHHRLLQLVGILSYSLYATHWAVVIVLGRFVQGVQWLGVLVAASLFTAAAVHLGVERPLRRLCTRWINARADQAPTSFRQRRRISNPAAVLTSQK
jgi:peptidoglycan/LPS O-acetylase OafA/YrhL